MRIADWFAKPTVEKMSAKRDIPGLVKATRHKDPAVRADAAWALSRMGSAQGYAAIAALEKEGADQLLAAYQKADGHAKIAVASALVHLGELRAIDLFLLQASYSDTFEVYVQLLAGFGDAVRPKMLAWVRDYSIGPNGMAAAVLDAVGWEPTGDEDHVWYLVAKRDWDGVLKLGAQASPVLITILSLCHHVSTARGGLIWFEAQRTLAKANWPAADEAETAWRLAAKHDWAGCAARGTLAVNPLVAYLRDTEELDVMKTLPDEWYEAEKALLSIGAPAVEPLVSLLDHGSLSAQMIAISALGKLRARQALDPILRYIKHESWPVRAKAARALRDLKDPRAIPPLEAALKVEDASEARLQLSLALSDSREL